MEECTHFPPWHLTDWRPVPELRGKPRAVLTRCYGEPVERSEHQWRFRMPRGCSYERSELLVRLRGERIVSAKYRTFVTGQHCELDF